MKSSYLSSKLAQNKMTHGNFGQIICASRLYIIHWAISSNKMQQLELKSSQSQDDGPSLHSL